jgi:hypothetical protein
MLLYNNCEINPLDIRQRFVYSIPTMNEPQEPMNEDSHLESAYEDRTHIEDNQEQEYDGGGWPGDGSGTDDFQDMNANEADDYRDEG